MSGLVFFCLLSSVFCLLSSVTPAHALNWYVNDTSTTSDSWTTAVGADTASCTSPISPCLTIIHALQLAKAGDTIFVDAGIFDSYVKPSASETAGINIDTDNITLIGKDSNSTIIDPPGAGSTTNLFGIFADSQVGLTIKNIAVRGAFNGIQFSNVDLSGIIGDSFGPLGNMGVNLISGSDSNTVSNNSVFGVNGTGGIGIRIFQNSVGSRIQFNQIVGGTGDGINLGANCNLARIVGNTVDTNGGGINLGASNSYVADNIIVRNAGAGVSIVGSNNAVVHNEIRANDTGVWFLSTAATNLVTKNNVFLSNIRNLSNATTNPQTITRNWWGTTDEGLIAGKFFDNGGNPFSPYRLGPVDTAPPADTTAPDRPLNVTLDTSVPGQIKISWVKPVLNEETNGGAVNLKEVDIYRLVNTPDTNNWGNIANEIALVMVGGGNDTFFVDTLVSPGNTYYYRLTAIDSALPFENESFFTDTVFASPQPGGGGPPPGKIWYVNDTSSAGDSFCYGLGSDTNAGDSPNLPVKTIQKAIQLAKANDSIYIDAGLYGETVTIDTDNLKLVGKDSSATVIDPPGAKTTGGLYGISATNRQGFRIKNLGITGANQGIRFSNVKQALIDGDSITYCGDVGIFLTAGSDNNILDKNYLNQNSSYSIQLDSGFYNSVKNNTSESNSYGILLFSGFNDVSNNTFDSNMNIGIYLSSGGDNDTIANNIVRGNGTYGIYVGPGTKNLLTGNHVKSNSTGIYLTAQGNLVRNNVVRNNTGVGILIDADTNTVFQNDILVNDTGVKISGALTAISVMKNNIINNTTLDFFSNAGNPLQVSRNWWGTTGETSIAAGFSDASSTFRPYRLGPVDTGIGTDTTAPAAPLNVTLDTSVAGQIKISWILPSLNEETNGGAVGYNGADIYRLVNTPDGPNWAAPINRIKTTSPTDTFFIDTTVNGGNTYYYRLTSHDSAPNANESFFTDTKFIMADTPPPPPPGGKRWFVNDTSATGDSYTYGLGSDTNSGDSPNLPFRTIIKALATAKAGDTILVDSGLFDSYSINAFGDTVGFSIDTNNISIIGVDSVSTVIDPPGPPTQNRLTGIYADTQVGLSIKNMGVTGAFFGITLLNVDQSVVTSVKTLNNGQHGIYLKDGSDTNTITNNISNSNTVHGIFLDNGSNGNTVAGNTCKLNVGSGIVVDNSFGNSVTNNSSNNNTNNGIVLSNNSKLNVVAVNVLINNTRGVYLDTGVNNNLIARNGLRLNTQSGALLVNAETNAFVQNDIAGNDTGVQLMGVSYNNLFSKNNIHSNTVNNVLNLGGFAQTMTRNWWNTTDESAINAKFADTASTFNPYRFGAVDTAPGADTTAPAAVVLTLDTSVASQIKLQWTIPALNEETNGVGVGFNGLNIYRTVNIPDTNNWHNSVLLVRQTNAAETTWIDTTVTGGNTYYYRATSKDASAALFNESFFSDTKSTVVSAVNPPGVLQILEGAQITPDVAPGETLTLRVIDTGANVNPAVAETVTVRIKNLVTSEQETAVLTELDTNNAAFQVGFRLSANSADNASGSGKLYILAGETAQFDYTDPTDTSDTKQVRLLAIAILDGDTLPSDTEIRQGDTAVILAFKSMNELPKDNASATDTVTSVRVTFIGVPDTYVKPNAARLWLDTGLPGKLEPSIDSILASATVSGGVCTFAVSGPNAVFTPGDTRHFLVTIEIVDSAQVGNTLDAKISQADISHVLGGLVPDSDFNSTGVLTVKAGGPNVLIGVSQSPISLPGGYNGPAGDSIPGSTLTFVIRYDNDGGETSVNFTLNAKIPQNTELGRGADSPSASALLSPHTGAAVTVTITDDTGNVVPDTDLTARRIRWTFSTGVGPNNGDPVGVIDAASSDVDAGFVKYKVYIK